MTSTTFTSHLTASDPLFAVKNAGQLLAATSTWGVAVSILSTVQTRCQEVDEAAVARAADLLAFLTTRPDGRASLQLAFEHLLDGLGRVQQAAAVGNKLSTAHLQQNGAVTFAVASLLEHILAAGGVLQASAAAAATAHALRAGAHFEILIPSLFSAGARSLDGLTSLSSGLLDRLQVNVLASQDEPDPKARLRVIECCRNLWDYAQARWPSTFDPIPSHQAKLLATRVVNTIVDTSVYDPIAKLRLAATRLALAIAPALDPQEVLKLALLKARDKDKATRLIALRMCALIGHAEMAGSGEEGVEHGAGRVEAGHEVGSLDGVGPGQDDHMGHGNNNEYDVEDGLSCEIHGGGIGAKLNAQQVHLLVMCSHDTGVPDDLKAFVTEAFWSFLISRQGSLPAALAELNVAEQLELYEPLLKMHIAEAFSAAFPDGMAVGGNAKDGREGSEVADTPMQDDDAIEDLEDPLGNV